MRTRRGSVALSPNEIDLLQQCFDTLLEKHKLPRTSGHADMIASSLFEAYRRGVTDEDELVKLAAVGIPVPQNQSRLSA